MSLTYTIEPIDVWPGEKTKNRTRSPFKTIWTKVLTHLEREIRQLGGQNIVFRLQVTQWDINKTGMLRADARIREPGVIIQFTATRLKGQPSLLYRCDRFPAWQDNVSAIARGLEALRLVDRYGVTPTGEQYAGFKALPAGTAATMTTEAAASYLASHVEYPNTDILRSPDIAKQAVRAAISRTHPDRNAGSRSAYDKVDVARQVLSAHHGVSL
jgi:hypothetical protein